MDSLATYRISDFLLFSPEAYLRLFERLNETLWPAQLGLLVVIVALLALVWRGQLRSVLALFALAWLLVAWVFFIEHYQQINWAAGYMAVGFALQALLLAGLAALPSGLSLTRRPFGLFLLIAGLVITPPMTLVYGLPLAAMEFFALMPDPTAIATLGLVFLMQGRARWILLPLPLIWCLASALTSWGLPWPPGLAAPVAALILTAGAGIKALVSPGTARS
ncbi:MAG: DUF6064 family protein [Pseudomonadota bacterium]